MGHAAPGPMLQVVTSAPGKVMISGEYVVLEGAPALVAAAGARATAQFRRLSAPDRSPSAIGAWPEAATLPPEVVHARALAERAFGALPGMDLSIDTSPLRAGGRKLGLGSSAAAAAAVVGAVGAAHGIDPSRARPQLLTIALEGHRAVAPQGSGADVAASVLGGFVRVQRVGERLDARPVSWPPELALALIWTGSPARTSDLVALVKRLESTDPVTYRRAIAPLHEAARALLGAIESGSPQQAIEAARAHGDAMQQLGDRAGAPISTPELSRAADLARELGGAAKPSGAGGGDVALAFLPSRAVLPDLALACEASDLTLLSIELGEDGLRQEAPPTSSHG